MGYSHTWDQVVDVEECRAFGADLQNQVTVEDVPVAARNAARQRGGAFVQGRQRGGACILVTQAVACLPV